MQTLWRLLSARSLPRGRLPPRSDSHKHRATQRELLSPDGESGRASKAGLTLPSTNFFRLEGLIERCGRNVVQVVGDGFQSDA
jgi:hypothetical protein